MIQSSIDTRTIIDVNGKTIQEANNDNQIYLPLEREVPVGAVSAPKSKVALSLSSGTEKYK